MVDEESAGAPKWCDIETRAVSECRSNPRGVRHGGISHLFRHLSGCCVKLDRKFTLPKFNEEHFSAFEKTIEQETPLPSGMAPRKWAIWISKKNQNVLEESFCQRLSDIQK